MNIAFKFLLGQRVKGDLHTRIFGFVTSAIVDRNGNHHYVVEYVDTQDVLHTHTFAERDLHAC